MILFNKPFQVLSCFTDSEGRSTLANYIHQPDFYAAGRLDYDSEGLLLLTDDGEFQQRLANPRFKLEKTYWVQVEGIPTERALKQLRDGVLLKDGLTRPASVNLMDPPDLADRNPPIRFRAHQPTQWIVLKISEGKNRQVRRMTAAVGYPTLRLVRYAIGEWTLEGLSPGEQRQEDVFLPKQTAVNRAKTKRLDSTNKRVNAVKKRQK